MSLLGSKCCLSYYVLLERGKLHGNVAVSHVMLQRNVSKQNSPVGESCVAVTHGSGCSISSNSVAAPKSTFMHSCHQHTFEHFLFMLVTLHVLCFQPSALTQRDVTAEPERSAVLALPVYCMTVFM